MNDELMRPLPRFKYDVNIHYLSLRRENILTSQPLKMTDTFGKLVSRSNSS